MVLQPGFHSTLRITTYKTLQPRRAITRHDSALSAQHSPTVTKSDMLWFCNQRIKSNTRSHMPLPLSVAPVSAPDPRHQTGLSLLSKHINSTYCSCIVHTGCVWPHSETRLAETLGSGPVRPWHYQSAGRQSTEGASLLIAPWKSRQRYFSFVFT